MFLSKLLPMIVAKSTTRTSAAIFMWSSLCSRTNYICHWPSKTPPRLCTSPSQLMNASPPSSKSPNRRPQTKRPSIFSQKSKIPCRARARLDEYILYKAGMRVARGSARVQIFVGVRWLSPQRRSDTMPTNPHLGDLIPYYCFAVGT